jgi:hypothetical protein
MAMSRTIGMGAPDFSRLNYQTFAACSAIVTPARAVIGHYRTLRITAVNHGCCAQAYASSRG